MHRLRHSEMAEDDDALARVDKPLGGLEAHLLQFVQQQRRHTDGTQQGAAGADGFHRGVVGGGQVGEGGEAGGNGQPQSLREQS